MNITPELELKLKKALAGMLPNEIDFGANLAYWTHNCEGIKETEWLEVCHKIEKKFEKDIALRVKWVNILRDIVAEDCPKNKVGVPLVSDIDILLADWQKRALALCKLKGINL